MNPKVVQTHPAMPRTCSVGGRCTTLTLPCCPMLFCHLVQVLVVITRWRTEANEERERQGLAKVYLLEHKAAEQEALRAALAEGGEGRTASELRKMRATQ